VFSTYLYTGNGTARDITNGIDLDGEGGLVWIKSRSNAVNGDIFDTERGAGRILWTASTAAEYNTTDTQKTLTSFNADGFSLGTDSGNWGTNFNNYTFASWTFRKAPKFFDVVTYTGTNPTPQNISHNLGSVPGMIVVKKTSAADPWIVYHRGSNASPEDYYLRLNENFAAANNVNTWNSTAPTDSQFTVGIDNTVNENGATYVAYLFAHNDGDGEFGEDADQDIIKCGSYTGNGSTDGPEIDLGFEPQWVLIKEVDDTGNWQIFDSMRGMVADGVDARIAPNLSNAEDSIQSLTPTATGFKINTTSGNLNTNNSDHIYIAIRRGPMKTPESGTEVFAVDLGSSSGNVITTGFPIDLQIYNFKNGDAGNSSALDRLRGFSSTSTESGRRLVTSAVNVESAGLTEKWTNTGFTETSGYGSPSTIYWNFRRAPGFFDVVAYEGNGSTTQNVTHNLGVTPELLIVKNRDGAANWGVWHTSLDADEYLFLNDTASTQGPITSIWNNTLPTDSVFSVGFNGVSNTNANSYIAYLFATVPGVSKVGSYTGNGTSQTIDCGFGAGARFVLTKRTNTTGNWNVWDSERGIVAGNDPRLELNTIDAEDTGHDYIDPDSSGFIVNYVADDDDDSNVSGDTYIFLAIA